MLILAAVGLCVAAAAAVVIHRTAFEVRRASLVERVVSRAALIEAIHRRTGSADETLAVLREGQRRAPSMGRTGELAIARGDGEQMVFLLSRRLEDGTDSRPARVPLASDLAAPMERALAGESGWMVGLDYDGRRVLAAYRPVPELGWGLVAKMDMREVRAPALEALALALGIGVLLVAAGTAVFLRTSEPLVGALERQTHELSERVKELGCLLGLSKVVERPGVTLPEVLATAAELLPPSLRYPEVAAARVRLGDEVYERGPVERAQAYHRVPIRVYGEETGEVEIAYTEQRPEAACGPFLAEEHALVEAVAERLGHVAGRYRAAAALEESEERFRSLFNQVPVGLYRTTPDGRFLEANPALAAILGHPDVDSVRATAVASVYTRAGERERWRAELAERGEVLGAEVEVRRADGTMAWVRHSARAVLDETGEVVAYEGAVEDITAQRRALAELLRSKAVLAHAQRIASLGSWEYDADSRRVTWSDEVYRIHGLEAGAYDPSQPEQDMQFYAPGDRERIEQAFLRAVQHGEPYDLDLRLEGADGVCRWVHTSGRAEVEDGRVRRVYGYIMDVTEEREAVLALAEREERFRKVFEEGPLGMAVVGPDFRFERVNPRLCQILGYRPEELEGRPFADITHPDDLDADVEQAGRLAAGEIPFYSIEKRYVRSDGEPLWIRLTGSVVRDDAGEPLYFLALVEDIDERRRISQELVERERLLDHVLEVLPVGVWIADAGGTIVRGNPAAHQVWQGARYVAPDEYSVYRGWWRATHAPVAAEEWALARAISRGETSLNEEIEIECFDGTRKIILNSALPMTDSAGVITGAIVANLDITPRVVAEEQLAEAMRELERSNAELQQFAYVASHDLQEPLRMVVSYLQLLERRLGGGLDERARTFLDFAVDGGKRMQRLIHDLLAYSRVQTHGAEFGDVDLDAVMRVVWRNLEMAIAETGAEVSWNGLPRVLGDEGQLVQLLQNLVANAIKFRGEAPPRVEIRAARENGGWRIAVADNGIGIAPEHAERIFNVFQRLHTRADYPGTGIGLAVAKRIVERHGGTIGVESAPGAGATFHFTLPNLESET